MGQTDKRVRFLSRGRGYAVFLTSSEAVISMRDGSSMRWRLAGSTRTPQIEALNELPGNVSYFKGTDRSRWRTQIPTYARVRYNGVYPGIDLVYYGNANNLECDFVVAPGADPKSIRLTFDGQAATSIAENGDLVLRAGEAALRLRKPVVYQEDDGVRRPIEGGYKLVRGGVAFEVASYDATKQLVIDPTLALQHSTYLGGMGEDVGQAVGLDPAGNIYVTGYTWDVTSFPGPASKGGKAEKLAGVAMPNDTSGSYDAFLVRMNPNGDLTHSVYFGGTKSDSASAFAVTPSGHVHIVGGTTSSDFPVTIGAPYQSPKGLGEAFIMTLIPLPDQQNPKQFQLHPTFSSYLGGNGNDGATGVSFASDPLDAQNEDYIYVTGSTDSTADFPVINTDVTNGTHLSGTTNDLDIFVANVNTAKSQFNFSTYLGGSGRDRGFAITGPGFITGETCSVDFVKPNIANAPQFQSKPPSKFCTAFMAHVQYPTQSGKGFLAAFTYLGGNGYDAGYSIAPLSGSELVIAGETRSTVFPKSTNSYGGDESDGFVAVVSADGGTLNYFRYLGGQGVDQAFAVTSDVAGQIYVAGSTCASTIANPPNNFPQVNGLPPDASNTQNSGYTLIPVDGTGCDAFVVKIRWDGEVAYSTYLGGKGYDVAWGITVDLFGAAYVTGATRSTNYPVTNATFSSGPSDAFVSKLDIACAAGKGPLAYTNTGQVFDTDTDCLLKKVEIALPPSKTVLAMRPDGAMVYATSYANDPTQLAILGVDLTNNTVNKLASINVKDDPVLAVSADSRVVVAGAHVESQAAAFNTAMDNLTFEEEFKYPFHLFALAPHPGPDQLSLRMYVSHENDWVSWIDRDLLVKKYKVGPIVNQQPGFIKLVDKEPRHMSVTPDGALLLAANNNGIVTFIDTTTDEISKPTVAVGGIPRGIAVTPKPVGGAYLAYVASTSTATCDGVTVINTKSRAAQCIPIPGKFPSTSAVAVTPDASKVYVSEPGKPRIWVIDTATNKVTRAILGVGTQLIPQSYSEIVIAPQDHNLNGISEEVDVDDDDPNSKSFNGQKFGDSSGGTIKDNGGTKVSVWHASPKGFWVRASVANNHDAQIEACNKQPPILLSPGTLQQIVCGSLTVKVLFGRAKLDLGAGVFASITTGGGATVTGNPGSYKVENIGNTTIGLVNATNQSIGSISAGQSYPAAPTVSCATIAAFTYDGNAHTVPNGTCTSNAAGSFTYSYSSGAAPVNVGTYPFMATFTSSDPQFTNGSAGGTITIHRRALTVTAANASKLLLAPNPAFTATYNGFAGAEGPAVLTGTLRFDTPATDSSPVGTYLVTPSGLASSNYSIAFVSGTLTITYNVCLLYDPALPPNNGAIAIRLRLCSATGTNESASGIVLTALKVTHIATNTVSAPVNAGGSNPDQRFRFQAMGYTYNLKTNGLPAGAYTLTLSVTNDPLTHNVPFDAK